MGDIYTDTHTDQGDLISLRLSFQNMKSRLKIWRLCVCLSALISKKKKEAYEIILLSVYPSPQIFRFLLGQCRIKGK
jgi:hypothetical protein